MSKYNGVVGFIMVGPPYCGKDTQAKFLEEKGFAILGTGSFLRKKCEEDPIFNQRYGSIMNEGGLLPDKVVTDVFNSYFNALSSRESWVMNGFPRTVGQYENIKEALFKKKMRHPIVVVIFKFATEKILFERSLVRATESGRADDKEGSFSKRINEYEKNAPEIISALKKDSFIAVELDATLSKEELEGRIERIVHLAGGGL